MHQAIPPWRRRQKRVRKDFCNLGLTATAIDARHQFAEPLRLRHPRRGAAFRKSAIINELDVEAATGGRFAEHIGLKHAGLVPRRLPAHGRIEREHQPTAPASLDRRPKRIDLTKEGIEVRARRRRRIAVGRPGIRRFRARRWRIAGPVFAHCGPSRRAMKTSP
jgi:hypothetical protein